MNIVVFGASGKTGIQVVQQALDEGHEVTGFVRDPKKLTVQHPKLTIVTGDVLDPLRVDKAIDGANAVIVALSSKPDTKATVLTEGTGFIIEAMKTHGVKRLIVESSYPMSGSAEGMKFLEGTPPDVMAMMKPAIDDKIGQEKVVRESGLEWTIVWPLMLTDGFKTGQYRIGETLEIKKTDVISRADVADFMLKAVQNSTWFRKTVTLAY